MFVTTAIHYVNGDPHIGHAFEFIVSDAVARWHRMKGEDVWFLTGTDEHGQKIEKKAESLRMSAKELCDTNSAVFRDLCDSLQIQYSRFIRTTDEDHYSTVNHVYTECKRRGDIYKGKYTGWYNVREESFVTNKDAELNDFKDPVTQQPLTKMEEECYFFRLSKYTSEVLSWLKNNPNLIVPNVYAKEIISILESEDFVNEDLCISRPKSSVGWGIPVPDDDEHVLYVWFDALVNYMSGTPNFQAHFPPDIQIIGKDIVWFHTVIWFSILNSFQSLRPPQRLFVHGFVCDHEGKKMSKSVGNVVDPREMLEKYGPTPVRYYLINNFTPGEDFNFSEPVLVQQHDSILLQNIGNYVSRVFSMANKYSESKVPEFYLSVEDRMIPFEIEKTVETLDRFISEFRLQHFSEHVFGLISMLNTLITETAVWQIDNPKYPNDTRDVKYRDSVLRTLLEGMYIVSHFIHPIIPEISNKIFGYLQVLPNNISKLDSKWDNLKPGHAIVPKPDKLFSTINTESSKEKMLKNMQKRTARKNRK